MFSNISEDSAIHSAQILGFVVKGFYAVPFSLTHCFSFFPPLTYQALGYMPFIKSHLYLWYSNMYT